jgi:ABC-2 type transport system ATP-binding protein
MDEADKLADRIAIIDLGQIMTIDTPDALKRSVGGDVVTLSPGEQDDSEYAAFMEKTKRILSGKEFVVDIQQSNGELAVFVDSGETAAPAIMSLLASEGIQVQSLSVSRPSLDDVFLKYTGRTMRAEEGSRTTFVEMNRRRNRR